MNRRAKWLKLASVLLTLSLPLSSARAQSSVNFNFDQVEISHLVEIVGGVTGKRFVLPSGVEGKVSVVTPSQIPSGDVFPLFLSILESSGFTVIQKSDAYHIIPLADEERISPPVVGHDATGPMAGMITKVIHLKHVSSVDMKTALMPLVRNGNEAAIVAFGPTNHLIITDTASRIVEIEKIIQWVDRAESSGSVEIIALKHASAEGLSRQLNIAMTGAEAAGTKVARHLKQVSSGGMNLPSEFLVVPNIEANALIVVGSPIQINEVKRLIEQLDIESAAGRGNLHAIFLNYLSAEEAAKSITALLAKSATKEQIVKVAVEPSMANNALLVNASPLDFEYVKSLVEQLDHMPEQVMVEVLIAEVTYDDNFSLGVEWATIDEPSEGSTTVIGRSRPGATDNLSNLLTQGLFPQGALFGDAHGTYTDLNGVTRPAIPFLINAMSADRDVKILSNVPLWAQNNSEATVSVVENIPVLSSTIEGGSGTSRDVIQNIERIDVGIKLAVTPLVNPNGEITMQLRPSIEAVVSEGSPDQPFTPTIAKREVSTTITISNKATVAISGLLREDVIEVENRIPILSSIPILGNLFKSNSSRNQKTNLLIFVTPHIVTDATAAKEMKEKWEKRTNLSEPAKNLSFEEPSED